MMGTPEAACLSLSPKLTGVQIIRDVSVEGACVLYIKVCDPSGKELCDALR